MGNCISCGTKSMVTVKLILLNGELKEFSTPVKVCSLLQKNADSFLCNSDEMDFDELVTAINEDEVLQPGQLYFELPLYWLTQRLQAEDMVSLAVKASAALTKTDKIKCGCWYRPKRIDPGLMFYGEEHVEVKQTRPPMLENSDELLVSVKKKGGTPGGVGYFSPRSFTAKLSVIHEEDYF